MSPTASTHWRKSALASLPMYDLPELKTATDALWHAIASRMEARGVTSPPEVIRGTASLDALWKSPRLLLSQTDGYALMTHLRQRVTLVATPSYQAPGCEGINHRGAVIVRTSDSADALSDLKGRCCAVNRPMSDIGMNLLRAEVSILASGPAFFGKVVQTGSHVASIKAIAGGKADVASVDAVTLALLQRLRPSLAKTVRVLSWTVRSPGLPLITSRRQADQTRIALGDALAEVAVDPALQDVREELMLCGFTTLPLTHYKSALHLAQIAADNGYPELR
jgi:ABC-type phosphate/phosphonate transport system substrate-binding protein